jgi:hypothetical protein
MQEHLQNLMS